MPIDVTKPGLLTAVQDHGRQGFYHLGIPPSGAMDQISFRSANLPIGTPTGPARPGAELPEELRVPLAKECELRLVRGLYDGRVWPESMAGFLAETWTVSSEADRIGYRLKGGTPLEFVPRTPPFGAGDDPSNIVDACYPIGSVQVPSGQEPIVLHRDAVSGGGYMMVGTVISADMDRIGQLPPNAKVRFVEVTLDEALAARAERERWLEQIRSSAAAGTLVGHG